MRAPPIVDAAFFDDVTIVLPPSENWTLREALQRVIGIAYPVPETIPDPTRVLPGVRLLQLKITEFPQPKTFLIRGHLLNPGRHGAFSYLWVVVGTASAEGPSSEEVATASLALRAPNVRHQLDQAETPTEFLTWVRRAGRPAAQNFRGDSVVGRRGFAFGGVKENIRRKAALWPSDFRDGLHPKIIASVLFMFFACFAPAVAFGGLAAQLTNGQIGAVEMIAATAVCGTLYALLSGQPFTILGSTGPVIIFIGLLYGLCTRWGIPFLPAFAWVGLWTSLILVVLAAVEASRLINLFTRFTDEIFAGLISLIFIVEAVSDTAGSFYNPSTPIETALLSLILALGTYTISNELSRLRASPYLWPTSRQFLADFGPTIAIFSMSAVAFATKSVRLDALRVPATIATTSGRPWLVDIFSAPGWVIVGAVVPALLVSLLLFLDQNITVRLVNNPANRLAKGAGYHLDLLWVGILVAVCSLFGLPWMVAATVRSLNHVQSLSEFERGSRNVVSVRENRLSGLLIHLLVGGSLLLLDLLRDVPMPVLFGLFFYMGIASMRGNQLFERLRLWFIDPAMYPDTHYLRSVPRKVVHRFTALQTGLLAALWAVKASPLGILFPLVIAMLVPLRFQLSKFFDPSHLACLDGEELPEQERYREIGP